jgi:hypothetical protein
VHGASGRFDATAVTARRHERMHSAPVPTGSSPGRRSQRVGQAFAAFHPGRPPTPTIDVSVTSPASTAAWPRLGGPKPAVEPCDRPTPTHAHPPQMHRTGQPTIGQVAHPGPWPAPEGPHRDRAITAVLLMRAFASRPTRPHALLRGGQSATHARVSHPTAWSAASDVGHPMSERTSKGASMTRWTRMTSSRLRLQM